jgi:hypothetical protein
VQPDVIVTVDSWGFINSILKRDGGYVEMFDTCN